MKESIKLYFFLITLLFKGTALILLGYSYFNIQQIKITSSFPKEVNLPIEVLNTVVNNFLSLFHTGIDFITAAPTIPILVGILFVLISLAITCYRFFDSTFTLSLFPRLLLSTTNIFISGVFLYYYKKSDLLFNLKFIQVVKEESLDEKKSYAIKMFTDELQRQNTFQALKPNEFSSLVVKKVERLNTEVLNEIYLKLHDKPSLEYLMKQLANADFKSAAADIKYALSQTVSEFVSHAPNIIYNTGPMMNPTFWGSYGNYIIGGLVVFGTAVILISTFTDLASSISNASSILKKVVYRGSLQTDNLLELNNQISVINNNLEVVRTAVRGNIDELALVQQSQLAFAHLLADLKSRLDSALGGPEQTVILLRELAARLTSLEILTSGAGELTRNTLIELLDRLEVLEKAIES